MNNYRNHSHNKIKYIEYPTHIEGIMPNGEIFYVDNEDYEFVKTNFWHIHDGYIRSTKLGFMHRKLVNAQKGIEVDHINRNRLDNRKTNLRLVTRQENMHNKSVYKTNSSGHSGVKWNKKLNKWMVQITRNKERKHLGIYENLQDAIIARKLAEQN